MQTKFFFQSDPYSEKPRAPYNPRNFTDYFENPHPDSKVPVWSTKPIFDVRPPPPLPPQQQTSQAAYPQPLPLAQPHQQQYFYPHNLPPYSQLNGKQQLYCALCTQVHLCPGAANLPPIYIPLLPGVQGYAGLIPPVSYNHPSQNSLFCKYGKPAQPQHQEQNPPVSNPPLFNFSAENVSVNRANGQIQPTTAPSTDITATLLLTSTTDSVLSTVSAIKDTLGDSTAKDSGIFMPPTPERLVESNKRKIIEVQSNLSQFLEVCFWFFSLFFYF